MKDMEIRGAGNLLGREQHGEIASVGYEMYLKLLDDVIGEKQNRPKREEVCLDLEYSGYIPNEYIADKSEKMAVYKRIASFANEAVLRTLSSVKSVFSTPAKPFV